jgi:hypothetical protein
LFLAAAGQLAERVWMKWKKKICPNMISDNSCQHVQHYVLVSSATGIDDPGVPGSTSPHLFIKSNNRREMIKNALLC